MPRNQSPTYATLAEWTSQEAIPFSLHNPAGFDTAVDRLVSGLSDRVALLGLGEALHFGAELLTLRNRLFQRLVAAHGYCAVAVESSFPRGYAVNEYVLGREPDSYAAVQASGFSHGFGVLAANRELVEWMRHYNATADRPTKLHFYGFDSPSEMTGADSPRQLLTVALAYLATVDAGAGQTFRERIEPLLGDDAAWSNPAAMMEPSKSIGLSPEANALRIEVEELLAELRLRRLDYLAQGDPDRYWEAVHHATLARQLLVYHAAWARPTADRISRGLGLRDALMADNLAYIVERERSRGKVLAFAHNSHLQRGQAVWELGPQRLAWWPAGAHLDQMLGPGYAVIGTAVGAAEAHGIDSPASETLEAQLTATPGPARFIPTRRGSGLPAGEIAALPDRPGSTRNTSYVTGLGPRSFSDFDWLAVLDRVGYAEGAPALPAASG